MILWSYIYLIVAFIFIYIDHADIWISTMLIAANIHGVGHIIVNKLKDK